MNVPGLTVAKTPRETARRTCVNVPQQRKHAIPVMPGKTIDISEVVEVVNIPPPTAYMTRPRDTKHIYKTNASPDPNDLYWSAAEELGNKYDNSKIYEVETIEYEGTPLIIPPICSTNEKLYVVNNDGFPFVVNKTMWNNIIKRKHIVIPERKRVGLAFTDDGTLSKFQYVEHARVNTLDAVIVPPIATPRKLSLNVVA